MALTPVDLDGLSKAELKERHLDLLERFCVLEEQMMALKDECPVLDPRRTADPQADAVHAGPGSRPGTGPPPDLVALRRSQSLLPEPDAGHPISPAPALRAHLHAPHRVRHARPAASCRRGPRALRLLTACAFAPITFVRPDVNKIVCSIIIT